MSEHNKQVVPRFYQEVLSGGRLDVVDELVTADHVMHDTSEPGLLMGAESIRRWTEARRIALPDLAITIDDEIVEGDKVGGTPGRYPEGVPASVCAPDLPFSERRSCVGLRPLPQCR